MRLIDADALKAEINRSADRAIDKIGVGHLLEKLLFTQVIEAVIKKIDEQPAAQMWVPCEERLPEMEVVFEDSIFKSYNSEPVIVQTKRGEIFEAFCEKTEYKTCWNSIAWYTFGTNGRKMKVMSKVVTWMPKPEPWEGEKSNEQSREKKSRKRSS